MKMHPRLVVVALLLALTACQPGAAEYTESEAPKALGLDNAAANVSVGFVPGSSRLLPRDAALLHRLATAGALNASDRITIAVSSPAALADARFAAISRELLRYGLVASRRTFAGIPPNRAVINSGRVLVTLPACPNWSSPPSGDFTNMAPSNFGCATAVNLGQMVASPGDLVEGRPVGFADAIPAAAAVQRYEADKVQLPTTAALGPVASPNTAPTGSGATGAGTAGSQP